MSDVRIATPADEEGIFVLCRALHEENGQHGMNPDKVRAILQKGVTQRGGIIGVIGSPDDIKACVCLLLDPVWYSDEYQLLELFNVVRTDCRQTDYAKQMLQFAKRCADEIKLDLTIGIISNIRTAGKVRLYERFFPKAGAFFVYSPSHAAAEKAA